MQLTPDWPVKQFENCDPPPVDDDEDGQMMVPSAASVHWAICARTEVAE